MANSNSLPISGAQLRLRRDFELCAFDENGKLLGSVSLKNRMVSVMFLAEAGNSPAFVITEDRTEPTQNYALHLPIALPYPDAEFYDSPSDSGARIGDGWEFQVAFRRSSADSRSSTLDGIGVVDIEDISVLPLPDSSAKQGGCLKQFCNCLFGVKPKGKPTQHGILGIPEGFPQSKSLQMKVVAQFQMNADRVVDGANHIRIGIFLGKASEETIEQPYLAIGANPLLVTLAAEPIIRLVQ